MEYVFLVYSYVLLYVSRVAMFSDLALMTIAVFLLYRAIRSRSALVMLVTQLITAAEGLFIDIRMLLGPPYDDGSHAGIMSFVYFITTIASLAFYISLIMVAIDIGKKLHPKALQGSPIRPFPV